MISLHRSLSVISLIVLVSGLYAQPAPGLKKLGISDIKPIPAVVDSVTRSGRLNSLQRVVQALDSQLIDRVQNTRKFEIIARSDLSSILKENDFTGGAFKVSGVDYLLVTTIDDFQDYEETATFAAVGRTATRRIVRFSAVGKIYDAASGKLLESANFQINNSNAAENFAASMRNGELSDDLLINITRNMADKIANRVVDVIFPARVLSKLNRQITINRGDGTGIVVGQVWEVFALGKELTDPDTGQTLGREELSVGRIRITRVDPKVSVAEALEDTGIDQGAVVRPVQ